MNQSVSPFVLLLYSYGVSRCWIALSIFNPYVFSLIINGNVSRELFKMNRDESDDDSLDREVLVSFHLRFFSSESWIFPLFRRCIWSYKKNKTDTMNGNSRRESETESSSSLASQDPPCRLFSSDSLRRRNHRSGQPLNLPIQMSLHNPLFL